MDCSMTGFPVLHHLPELLKLMFIESVMPSISSSAALFSSCPQSFPASWSFLMSWLFASVDWSFSISPSNEYSVLISFRMDWFDLLACSRDSQESSPDHSSKASILWHSAFFTVQLSHPYMTTGKTIALTIQTFVGKVMSLLFNTLSRFVIVFLPRSKHHFISLHQLYFSIFEKMLTPWKKCYDKPRQHIKKQRHHFGNKGPSSQSYGFSSSHAWMWELDHK